MGRFVISYPRENRSEQEMLVRHLRQLGHSVFVDVDLPGSVSWWNGVLAQIRSSDAIIAIVSSAALNSVACGRERSYALALGKPILPIAVEPLTQALPRELSLINVVDYSKPGEEAAFSLAAALAALPPAPELPSPLPPSPEPPLSYLSDLVETVESPNELSGEQQIRLLDKLEPALNSADSEEMRGGQLILEKLARRQDLRASVEHRILAMRSGGTSSSATLEPEPRSVGAPPSVEQHPSGGEHASELVVPAPKKRSKVVTTLAVIGAIFVILILIGFCSASSNNTDYYYGLALLTAS